MKFLVVDDSKMSQTVIQKLLSRYGDVDVVENGEIGLEMFKQATENNADYTAVLLDIDMPVMDGQELLTEIRSFEQKLGKGPHECVKVIMMTAHEDPTNILTAFREQCDGYLVKPVTGELLDQRLKDIGILQA